MIIHSDDRPAFEHVHRYNSPNSLEIAAINSGAEDGIVGTRYIKIRQREELDTNGFECFSTNPVTHRSYDLLSYMLLLPHGTDCWFFELRLQSSSASRRQTRRMAMLMFYAYEIFQRPNQSNTILRGGRSFQQYIVDQFCKVNSERLEYLRHNQVPFRSTDYKSLCEQLGGFWKY